MELLLAARVQQDSLPKPFDGDKVRVGTIFEPYSMVSGDFFNYKWFKEQNKLCGYIIDVSGHGVATALQTATFKMMLDNVLLTGEKIEVGVLKIINKRIMPYLYEDTFVALLYFEFDLQAAVLKLISAGITLFLAAKPQECSLVPISGCYLGMIDNPDIEVETIPLKAGEIYCMMSDGASDLVELHGLHKQGSFTEYLNWLAKLAESPERNDDFSVICIEILQEKKETNVLDIKHEGDLARAQMVISEFLERNAPSHALILEVAIHEALNNGFCAGGRVTVKTRRVGGKLIIRVKDYGLGFNPKDVNVERKKENYDNYHEYLRTLERLKGRGEWAVKAYLNFEKYKQFIIDNTPAIRERKEMLPFMSVTASFLIQRKIDNLIKERMDKCLEAIIPLIAEILRDASEHDSISDVEFFNQQEVENPLFFKASYLVEKNLFHGFNHKIKKLSAELEPEGITLVVSGPWPPYSFVEDEKRSNIERSLVRLLFPIR